MRVVGIEWRPPRQEESDVGPIYEALRGVADRVDSTLGEQVDRARAIEKPIARMEPLANAPVRQRVGEQEDDVAEVLKSVVGVGVDPARPPRAYGWIRHLGRVGDVALGHSEGAKRADDLMRLDCAFENRGHAAPDKDDVAWFRSEFRLYVRIVAYEIHLRLVRGM